jgi:ubiquitin C-terminal hydrolase
MSSPVSILDSSVGLTNMGNTCFLNSALQALMRCATVGKLFLSDEITIREESNKKEMVVAFRTLLRDFWAVRAPPLSGPYRPSLLPGGFVHSLYTVLRETGDDWHRRGQQSDAAEAIQHILEYLHDGMYYPVKMGITGAAETPIQVSQQKALESWIKYHKKEYSEIVETFTGQTRITITCSECHRQSENFEPNLMLKPPIPGAKAAGGPPPTLVQCMEEGFAPEDIPDYDCSNCKKKGKAVKQEQIARLPPVQLVAIKRFINIGPYGTQQRKVRGYIPWDLDAFDFTPWCAFPRNPYTNEKQSCVYTTEAIIEHHGSMGGGHYLMYNRTSEGWVCCDDSSVTVVSPSSVITEDSYIAVMVPTRTRAANTRSFAAGVEHLRATRDPPPPTGGVPSGHPSGHPSGLLPPGLLRPPTGVLAGFQRSTDSVRSTDTRETVEGRTTPPGTAAAIPTPTRGGPSGEGGPSAVASGDKARAGEGGPSAVASGDKARAGEGGPPAA